MRRARWAALATALVEPAEAAEAVTAGWPYASLVTVACDWGGSPIVLLSGLSDHTRNLEADGRASLLFEEASRRTNPQTGPRVTVMGRLTRTEDERHAGRFLARHPQARRYAGFGDFHFYTMAVERAHYVGGFARAVWLRGAAVAADAEAAAALAACEQGVLEHMNRDHGEAIVLYANVLLGRRGKAWKMIGVDPHGVDLRLGGRVARLDFDAPVRDAESCRAELVRLAQEARRREAPTGTA
jgi:putative heme iron utilization protein